MRWLLQRRPIDVAQIHTVLVDGVTFRRQVWACPRCENGDHEGCLDNPEEGMPCPCADGGHR